MPPLLWRAPLVELTRGAWGARPPRFVAQRPDGTWCYEYEGRTHGRFDTEIEAAKKRRQEVDNARQRNRRALEKTSGEKMTLEEEEEAVLVDYTSNPRAAAFVGLFLNEQSREFETKFT